MVFTGGLTHYYRIVFVCGVIAVASTMNVLFLVADDMRPQLNCYQGSDFPSPVHPTMYTPNLDKLASGSLLLKRSYVQQAVCSPSRTSLLTGRRPDTTHVYDLGHYFRKVGGNYTTIPQYFKENGYVSVGAGKVFHPGGASHHDDPISWSIPYFHAPNYEYWQVNISSYAVTKEERLDHPLPDEQLATYAITMLQKMAPNARAGKQPFFLAVGFHKPHLPFVFPREYLDLYPEENISLPPNPYAPAYMPAVAWWDYLPMRTKYADIQALHPDGAINSTLPDHVVRKLRRTYYSSISYVDTLVGQILDALESLGLDNDTIVSFWGDHGWQLGEHGEWCKETNFELATHAPMMVRIPGLTDTGIVSEALTEFVDLFPTLVDAAGLPPLPLCPQGMNATRIRICREGTSMLPLIKDPLLPWKTAAFSQFPRPGFTNFTTMGYTMRTQDYRYTEWVGFDHTLFVPIWDNLTAVELYDHRTDPQENWNRAYDASYSDIRQSLSKALHLGWRSALPQAWL